MKQIKLLSMTSILTVLIWAGADSLVNETASIRLHVDLVPRDDHSTMLIDDKDDAARIDLEISGPRNIINHFIAQAPFKVRLPIEERPTGHAEIRLDRVRLKRMMEQKWHEFRELTIVTIKPNVIHVHMDHWVTRSIAITANQSRMTYDGTPLLKQNTASVRMRESIYLKGDPADDLQIDISHELDRLFEDQPAGKRITLPVPIDTQFFGSDAVIHPNTIEVTAAVQANLATEQISTVPILLAISVANLEKTVRAVTRDGNPLSLMTQTITVVGQREEVARLTSGETRAYGIIQLKQEDFDALDTLKLVTPDYRLPEGVKLSEQPPPIEFKLVSLAISTDKP